MKEQLTLNGLDFSPEENLSRYLQSIKKFPILSSEEEYDLALRYQQSKDKEIAYKLITSHLRLVVKVVSKYRGYGLPVGEMISEGNIGLMYAIDKFAPEKGFRFSTYALWWIKASVQKYILNSWSLVKLGTTAAQKKLFFNLKTFNIWFTSSPIITISLLFICSVFTKNLDMLFTSIQFYVYIIANFGVFSNINIKHKKHKNSQFHKIGKY